MTPEQKQRIQQIEARQNLRSGRVMLAAEGVLHDDADFLLSLVKSQEAPPTLMSSEVALKIALHIKGKNSDYFLMREGLAELESIVSKHFANAALSNTATSMRSACVEKVAETHDSVESACNAALMDVYDLSIANAPMPAKDCREIADCIGDRVGQIRKAIAALTEELGSLSIEKTKE